MRLTLLNMQTCDTTSVIQTGKKTAKLILLADPAWLQTPSTSSKSHFMVDFSDQHQPFSDDQSHAISLEYPH